MLAGFSLGEADLLRRAMGKKIKAEMDAQRAGFVAGCERVNGIPRGQGQRAVRPDRQVRRLRLQQEPRRRLRAARLSDRLAEGASSGRILRRLDVLRHRTRPTSSPSSSTTCGASGVACLPPVDQRQRGRVLGRADGEGHAVRYALGALKGVGEKAMEQLVDERARSTAPFASLDDFAARIDPRLLNRRQIESLAGGGAFDGIAERWAVVRRGRDHPRRRRQRRRGADQRAGRPVRRGPGQCRPDPHADAARTGRSPSAWPPRRRASASISPPIRSTITATSPLAHGARSFAELAALPAPADGGRTGAVMAGLVEDARWRTSAEGRRYMMATLSDSSGQFEATVFDDDGRRAGRRRRQGGRLRPAHRRARPPPGRGDAARHDPLAAVASRASPSAAGCSSRSRSRTRRRSAGSPPRSPGERGGNGQLRLKRALATAARPSSSSAATSCRRRARRAARADRRRRRGPPLGRRSAAACAGLLSAIDSPARGSTRGGSMLGGMQDFELRVPRLIDHAEREHGRARDRHPLGRRQRDPHQLGRHRARCEEARASA